MNDSERDQIADLRVFLVGAFARNDAAHETIAGRLGALETVQEVQGKEVASMRDVCKKRGLFGTVICFAGACALAIKGIWK